jgi:hypothetical protein
LQKKVKVSKYMVTKQKKVYYKILSCKNVDKKLKKKNAEKEYLESFLIYFLLSLQTGKYLEKKIFHLKIFFKFQVEHNLACDAPCTLVTSAKCFRVCHFQDERFLFDFPKTKVFVIENTQHGESFSI